jgi:hypothetical protein
MSRSKHRLADGASIAEHARRLKRRAGWDPAGQRADSARAINEQLGALRVTQATQEAQACEACAREREAQADPGALCREHLSQAMGLSASA